MTSRCGWLLLGLVVGMPCLPGCFSLRPRNDDGDSVRQIEIAPPDVAHRRLPPTEELAAAKTGDSAYPPVIEVAPPPEEVRPVLPPAPMLQGPPSTAPTDPEELAVHQAPAAADAKPQAEPPMKLAPFVLALQCILDEHHQDALKHLQAYDAETQEFYLRILPTVTMLARKRIDQLTVSEVGLLNAQLQSLLIALRPRTELAIGRMCYCERFQAFGVYQPLPDSHAFAAPSGDRPAEMVTVYVEVRNVASVERGSFFETRLVSTVEIRDAKGQRVTPLIDFTDSEKKPLRTLSRLNDYCNRYTFPVPHLPPGNYQLVLRIADQTNPGAPRVAQKTLEFRVSPIGGMAGR